MKTWVITNLREINQSGALRFMGGLLALTHIATFWWWSGSALFDPQSSQVNMCWSFFPGCDDLGLFKMGRGHTLAMAYLITACTALLAFLSKRFLGLAWLTLTLAWLLKLSFYIFDHALAANVHAVLFLVNAIFLFIPQKNRCIRFVIIASYFTLAFFKLNSEWLAGFWVSTLLPEVPVKGAEWIAALSLCAEAMGALLLLSTQWQLFFTGWSILVGYHIGQAWLLGPYHSALMCLSLVYVARAYFESRQLERERLYQSYLHPEPSRAWIPGVLAVFFIAQTFPAWTSSHLLKEGPWVLTALKTPAECHQYSLALYADSTKELADIVPSTSSPDQHCSEPYRRQILKVQCSEHSKEAQFRGIASEFRLRSKSQSDYKTLFAVANACEHEEQK